MEYNQVDTSIREAARRGELWKLLESEENELKETIRRLATTRDADGRTLLYDAVVGGNVGDCQRVLDMRDKKGSTASDVNMRDDGGWSPLMSACSSNRADVASWLLDRGSKLDDKYRDVFYAASKGDAQLMEIICGGTEDMDKRVPDLTKPRNRGSTLLHRAVGAGNVGVIEWLVERLRAAGVNVDEYVVEVKDGAGETVMDVLEQSWAAGAERERVRGAVLG